MFYGDLEIYRNPLIQSTTIIIECSIAQTSFLKENGPLNHTHADEFLYVKLHPETLHCCPGALNSCTTLFSGEGRYHWTRRSSFVWIKFCLNGHLPFYIKLEYIEETGSTVALLESQVIKQLSKLLLVLAPAFGEHFL